MIINTFLHLVENVVLQSLGRIESGWSVHESTREFGRFWA